MRIGDKSKETAITVLGAFKDAIRKTGQINVRKENEEETIEYIDMAIEALESQPKIGEWIPCSERLPEEHDSIFAKFKGTEKWHNGMFEKTSDEVNVTVEFDDGTRKTKTLYTIDGRWNEGNRGLKFKVIAWQPLPEEYRIH